jgi:hypothetical protein
LDEADYIVEYLTTHTAREPLTGWHYLSTIVKVIHRTYFPTSDIQTLRERLFTITDPRYELVPTGNKICVDAKLRLTREEPWPADVRARGELKLLVGLYILKLQGYTQPTYDQLAIATGYTRSTIVNQAGNSEYVETCKGTAKLLLEGKYPILYTGSGEEGRGNGASCCHEIITLAALCRNVTS